MWSWSSWDKAGPYVPRPGYTSNSMSEVVHGEDEFESDDEEEDSDDSDDEATWGMKIFA